MRYRLRHFKNWLRSQKHYRFYNNHPKVFCNGFHKSGNQLLLTAIKGIPGIQHYDRSAFNHFLTKNHLNPERNTNYKHVINQLQKLLPGELIGGHVEYNKALDQFCSDINIKHLLVLRDPRDMIVSNLNWWSFHQEIDVWPFRFFKALSSQEEQLHFLILGDEYSLVKKMDGYQYLSFPNVVKRMETFLPWLESNICGVLRFEELKLNPDEAFRKIYSWIWDRTDPPKKHLDSMRHYTNPRNSKTYFRSEINQWPKYFNNRHYASFKEIGGDQLLKRLNYT